MIRDESWFMGDFPNKYTRFCFEFGEYYDHVLGSAPCLQGQGQEQGFSFLSQKYSQVDSTGYFLAPILVRKQGQGF